MDNVAKVIEEKIRPILAAHEGGIELVEVTPDGYVKVKLTGACATCPGAQLTMTDVVEEELRAALPEIKGVIAVHGVSDDLIKEALKILRKDKQ